MKRRDFFVNTSLAATGAAFLLPFQSSGVANALIDSNTWKSKAKNIIFMVSDGMSSGTLDMADLFLQRRDGRGSNWINLYRENIVTRAHMDMASASSLVTDSAAASSSWGGGVRVKNGRLNYNENGEVNMPIWQKFKTSGKKVGCVTTVPITHATPAGFCVTSKTRGEQAEIAEMYLDLRFDVMMGGGSQYFEDRKDNRNLFTEFAEKGFQVLRSKNDMITLAKDKPVMGVFDKSGLPYELDRLNDEDILKKIPSLAEMASSAIELMKDNKQGFCLQVEAGKVDWAAHANDGPAIIYDQVAFDDAIKVVMDFAQKDGNTLVIITSDHGNANPGLYYGEKADKNFETLFDFKHTNDWVLMNTLKTDTSNIFRDRVMTNQLYDLTEEQATELFDAYQHQSEDGAYNSYKLPFERYAHIQKKHTSVAFGSMEHSADFTELAMFGPGSENLKPFVTNTDLHTFMLHACHVENKF